MSCLLQDNIVRVTVRPRLQRVRRRHELEVLSVGADVSRATQPPCSSVLVCPCLACPPLRLPPAVSFLRASSSEPKQQFHLFCQGWECTQPSLVVLLPAPLDAKPVDLTDMPAPLFLCFLSVCLSLCQCLG